MANFVLPFLAVWTFPAWVNLIAPAAPTLINCQGSSKCPHLRLKGDPIPIFHQLLVEGNSVLPGGPPPRDTYYHEGNHIACYPSEVREGGLCVFVEGIDIPFHGINASLVTDKLKALVDHGCKICGSVQLSPYDISMYDLPETMGRLVVNYVKHRACYGMCEWHGYTGWVGPLEHPWTQCAMAKDFNKCLPPY